MYSNAIGGRLKTLSNKGDPNTSGQWYFDRPSKSDMSIEVEKVWEDYTGTGVTVGVMDSIIRASHLDIAHAYDPGLDIYLPTGATDFTWDSVPNQHYHGTAVAGVIFAERDNEHGSVGVAYGATLASFVVDFSDDEYKGMINLGLRSAASVDVLNASWSHVRPFTHRHREGSDTENALLEGIEAGRDGLGTVIVFAGGNSAGVTSSNYFEYQNSPYTIAVGAVASDGNAAGFSSLGANLLISAAGQDIITSAAFKNGIDQYSGTSFAAPMVSAAAALMLEANPTLGYRDVAEILALSARADELGTDDRGGLGWVTNGAVNFNNGGMHHSDSYGYGYLNVQGAVRLAETWHTQKTFYNLIKETHELQFSDAVLTAGKQDTIRVDFEVTSMVEMEAAEIAVRFAWPHSNDIEMFLISPQGTVSQLTYDFAKTDGGGSFSGFTFTTRSVLGEGAEGTWALEIVNTNPDAKDNTTGEPMSAELKSLEMTVFGSTESDDNVYFYNDEYANGYYSDTDMTERRHLSDTDGGVDTINAAMVTLAVSLDLSGRTVSQIGGEALYIAPGQIENAFAGDGDDQLIGSDADNILFGGRGEDTLVASDGSDMLDGGRGTDIVQFSVGFLSLLEVSLSEDGALLFAWGDANTTQVKNVELFEFTDGLFSLDDLLDGYPDLPDPAPKPDPDPNPDADPVEDPVLPAPDPQPSSADLVRGTLEDDLIYGLDGDDTLLGRSGADVIDGGSGNDRIVGAEDNDTIFGGDGDDTLLGSQGENYIDGGDGDDRLVAGFGHDTLLGGDGEDVMVGFGLSNYFDGGAGSDRMVMSDGVDTVVLRHDATDLDRIVGFDTGQDKIAIHGASGHDDVVLREVGGGTYLGIDRDGSVFEIGFFTNATAEDLSSDMLFM